MSQKFVIKTTVTTLIVKKPLQKINFQIRHPENTQAIIGIAVTCNLSFGFYDPALGTTKDTAGNLSLAIPQKGDVVYGEDVKLDNNDYSDIPTKMIYGIIHPIGEAKKRNFFFQTDIKTDKAILEGFYEDVFAADAPPDSGLPSAYPYRIKIYLRYQRIEEEIIHK